MGKQGRKKNKKKLPVLESDHDFLKAFSREKRGHGPEDSPPAPGPDLNRHGLPVIRDLPEAFTGEDEAEEEFEILLEASFKQTAPRPRPVRKPVSLHKKLKRYPGPEKELDLHGFTALGAQLRAKSFILSCKHQGFFTLRIIVGRGLHSDLGPVLPDVIQDLLKELKNQDVVVSYQWEQKKKARSGALIVYLKQFKD